MKMNHHNDEIEKTLNSLDGIQRATPPEGFRDRVLERVTRTTPVIPISAPVRWAAGIAASVLIAFNVFTYMSSYSNGNDDISTIVEEYSLNIEDNYMLTYSEE